MPLNDEKQYQYIGRILSDLSRQSEKYWRKKETLNKKKFASKFQINYYTSMNERKPIKEAAIKALFKDNAERRKLSFNYLYLPPLEDNLEFVPILSLECNLTNPTSISMRIEMVGFDEDKNTIGFGLRFESPGSKSNHKYWHIQIITKHNEQKLMCPPWLPQTEPCIPVKVKEPIEFILYLLICFYGFNAIHLIKNMHLGTQFTDPVQNFFI